MRRLVLGGARSGKSTWAESQFREVPVVDYVATSRTDPDDPEWQDRVATHRARRPRTWRTHETIDLVAVLGRDDPAPVLIDCLAVWLARVMDSADAWSGATDPVPAIRTAVEAFVEALRSTSREVVVVSNEVGWGIVPADAGSRLYRDELGRLNAATAAVCDEVWLCVAGIPKRWA